MSETEYHSLTEFRRAARAIFDSGLRAVDARETVKRVFTPDGLTLKLFNYVFALNAQPVYVIGLGKAGLTMAAGLDEVLGERIRGAVVSGPPRDSVHSFSSPRWQVFAGGHPLPNQHSLDAAKACFELLHAANDSRALVIFLVSGGGSAMIEWPRDDRITLEDLREANRVLVSSGAAIREINAVRQTFSAVKAGALAECAPNTDQITLIVSDTNVGDEAYVASGPSLQPPNDSPTAIDVITRYNLFSRLPRSILECGALAPLSKVSSTQGTDKSDAEPPHSKRVRKHHVLLDNLTALNAAAQKARELGYTVAFAHDLVEQPIEEGCHRLIARLKDEWRRQPSARPICLLSGGEFACPVKGSGVGGRNLETALRCSRELLPAEEIGWKQVVILSAGTDGIDGNSPAAGAITDQTTVSQAHSLGLSPGKFLEQSDSFTLLQALKAVIFTGPTGTNVRDVRVLLAS